ncbi:13014_t:CDS:2 [Cetraspora pellucida]|uniref:13014_t:CDS:1 n=1 Tax=Cetraspora pellucida TaxID=1433469 RepID=A0A9N9BHV1_9GLOM|nr:13014_t:CDS:2 [Cetraspora pellucida]
MSNTEPKPRDHNKELRTATQPAPNTSAPVTTLNNPRPESQKQVNLADNAQKNKGKETEQLTVAKTESKYMYLMDYELVKGSEDD